MIRPQINSVEYKNRTFHVEPKVMQVLLTLASRPGDVITREQIRAAVWSDVFVGEDVLIRAISELRRIFKDDPKSQHTIQTVPKVGYRLIAPVTEVTEGSGTVAVPVSPTSLQAAAAAPAPEREVVVPVPTRASSRLRQVLLWFVAGVLVAFAAFLFWRHSNGRSPASYISLPLTTYTGSVVQPAFSPDGNAIAFVWHKSEERLGHVYVKALNSAAPVRLTTTPEEEMSPSWSPDGHSIALIRHSEQASIIEIVPALGGSEQQVYTLTVNSVWEYGGLTWSSDGGKLIFPQRSTASGPSEIVELDLKNHSVRKVTNPSADWDGDWMPAASPDGKLLSFVRGSDRSVRDLYVMDMPNGTPRRLTFDHGLIVGTAWTPSGSSIIFSSNRGGTLALWRVAADGGTPEREAVGTDDAYAPTIARSSHRLAYCHGNATWSIVRFDSSAGGKAPEEDILTSSEQDSSPSISAAGDRIAFQSWRSGAQEIWSAGIDGRAPVQLTNARTYAGSPAWSPDGQFIAFDGRPDGFRHIYLMDANGGEPRILTSGNFNDIVPGWSADGRWIYFGSNRSGSWQIWRIPAHGSAPPQQMTSGGGMIGKVSADGHWLYYTQFQTPGLWRCPLDGGPETKIADIPLPAHQNYWSPTARGIYVLDSRTASSSIALLHPENGQMETIRVMKHDPTPFAGLALTPDGKQLFVAELARAESNLTLVENFR